MLCLNSDIKDIKVRLIGIQLPSINGGITYNYGCSGPYHDTFGEVSTCMFYCEYLQELVKRDEYKDYVKYVDLKSQFDVEYNMPTQEFKVNNRSNIVESLGVNGVHPTMAGYLQIGDCFYRSLVSDLIKEEE